MYDSGCWSHIGSTTESTNLPYQEINLGSGCFWKDIIEHEIFHTLGFFHEQERPDRDDHIIVHYENVLTEYISQYRIMNTYSWQNTTHPYDYNSLMHYTSNTFSNGRGYTMTRRDNGHAIWPVATRLSTVDVLQLITAYQQFCFPMLPSMTLTTCQDELQYFSIRKCDGEIDCEDGTDEDISTCQEFQCGYEITLSGPDDLYTNVWGRYLFQNDTHIDGYPYYKLRVEKNFNVIIQSFQLKAKYNVTQIMTLTTHFFGICGIFMKQTI